MTVAERELSAVETFETRNPATGELVATLPVHGEQEVRAAVSRAREAQRWWAAIGFDERRRRLLDFAALIASRADELARLVHRDNGKPVRDGFVEVAAVVTQLDWVARNAKRALRPERRVSWPVATTQGWVEHRPAGVVGIIGPWNYPVVVPLHTTAYALGAGNAVVFKPSEHTPAVGRWLVDAFAEVVPEQPVLQGVYGYGETGHALVTSGVDKVSFTGSPATGRKVMKAAADSLTPVLLELGGKDPMIVDDDANVERAAQGAAWGGLANAGQTCVGIERIYATDAVHDRFVERLAQIARDLRVGGDEDADIGPITMPDQIDVIRRHVEDALDRGATPVVGGRESIDPPFVHPVVLTDVPDDALVLREETFGPVLPVVRVADADEAVALANDTDYGLGSAIFGRRRAVELARRVRAGMTSINDVISYFDLPTLPFGGIGESGFGRTHGPDGLKEFSRPHTITKTRGPLPLPVHTFERPEWLLPVTIKAIGRAAQGVRPAPWKRR